MRPTTRKPSTQTDETERRNEGTKASAIAYVISVLTTKPTSISCVVARRNMRSGYLVQTQKVHDAKVTKRVQRKGKR